ncbi:MAG TPA: hypothetical protein PL033_20505 [Candidatus Brocadiia bacterium]|nr:hypothetical protein [Candidatus Brocadiia bacterium]
MSLEEIRAQLREGRHWSSYIGSCGDKELYAYRVWDLFDSLGIVPPDGIYEALKALHAWEDCQEPCAVVNGYLTDLLAMNDADLLKATSGEKNPDNWFRSRHGGWPESEYGSG